MHDLLLRRVIGPLLLLPFLAGLRCPRLTVFAQFAAVAAAREGLVGVVLGEAAEARGSDRRVRVGGGNLELLPDDAGLFVLA